MSNMIGGREAGEGSTPKKRLKTRSEVWEHFVKRANCKYCNRNFSLKCGTTTHLKRHLSSCDKLPKRGIAQHLTTAESNKRATIDQPPTTAIGDEVRDFGLTPEKIREVDLKNAILADFPFAPPHVKKAWSSLMVMDMEKEICAYHQREKEKLVAELGNLTSCVSFSIDIMEEGWVSITAHFINDDFNLVKKLIGFKKLPYVSFKSYEAAAAADIIESCMSDWKLENKIFTFTYINELEAHFPYYHVIHSLERKFHKNKLVNKYVMHFLCFRELVATDYFNDLKRRCSVEKNKIINFLQDVLQNWSKRSTFNKIAKEKKLPPINEDWLKVRPTAWYAETNVWEFCCSIAKMFKDALLYEEVFSQCALTETKTGESPFSEIDPQGIDWQKLEKEVDRMEMINSIIGLLFNFKYPTSNLYFRIFLKNFHELLEDNDEFVYRSSQDIFFVACVLDPRYKLRFLEYCFEKIDFDDDITEINDGIRELFETLFGLYAKEETNRACSLSPGTANTQADSSSSSSIDEDPSTIIDGFPLYIKKLKTTRRFEMDQYLADEIVEIEDRDFDLLDWWRENRSRYPVLSRMARDVLAIPIFVYRVEENLRLDLSVLQGVNPELVEAVICSKDWILSDVQSLQEVGRKLNNKKPSVFAPKGNSHNAGEETDISDNGHDSEEEEKKTKVAIYQVIEKIRRTVLCDKFRLGLNREEILAVELVEQIEQTAVIVKMEGDNSIRLTGHMMNSLVLPSGEDGEARWLSDEVIDAYINIIKHRKDPSRKVLIVSTLHTQWLRRDIRTRCKTTLNTIKDFGIKFLDSDLVFFPINNGRSHWLAGALNFESEELQILDSKVITNNSATGNPYDSLISELRSGIQQCILSALHRNEDMWANRRSVDVTRWKVSIIRTVPQQDDLSSCGLFTLRYIEFWNGKELKTSEFSQSDMERFRKRIVSKLIMSEFNLMKVVPQEIRKLLNEAI